MREKLVELLTDPCEVGTECSEAVNVLTNGRKVLTAIWNGLHWTCDAEFWDADEIKLNPDLPYKASVRRVIAMAPTVDAVKVVRCKDCVFCYRDADGVLRCGNICGLLGITEDSFCSRGVR